MFKKLLVPLDGSSLAECVLPHVAALAEVFGSEVTLLRVVEAEYAQRSNMADPLAWQMRRLEAGAYLEGIGHRLAGNGVKVVNEVLEGAAAARIIEQAELTDLLVLCTHGCSGLGPWSAGGVTQKVIEQVKRSVLLVRAFEETGRSKQSHSYRRIVVALDGSKRAEAVLPAAARIAEHWKGKVVLLHVVSRTQGFWTEGTGRVAAETEALVRRSAAEAGHYLRRVQGRLAVNSERCVVASERPTASIEDANVGGAGDLLLASAHGAGADCTRRFGSKIGEAIRHGKGPLLIYQDMRPEQIAATAVEAAAERTRGERFNASWDAPRPERIRWHSL